MICIALFLKMLGCEWQNENCIFAFSRGEKNSPLLWRQMRLWFDQTSFKQIMYFTPL